MSRATLVWRAMKVQTSWLLLALHFRSLLSLIGTLNESALNRQSPRKIFLVLNVQR